MVGALDGRQGDEASSAAPAADSLWARDQAPAQAGRRALASRQDSQLAVARQAGGAASLVVKELGGHHGAHRHHAVRGEGVHAHQ